MKCVSSLLMDYLWNENFDLTLNDGMMGWFESLIII